MDKYFIPYGAESITAMIRDAISSGAREVVITGNWEITGPVRIPSNFTLNLINCHLRLADGVYSNIFVNEHHDTPEGNTLEGRDRNIRIIGYKPDGSGWGTGIKDPEDPQSYALTLTLADTSCVTSGDYERYFVADGVKYHHIIDKDTLMPAMYFSSVTVITEDSGLADALSTALFAMSYEDGLALIQKLGNIEVLWIKADGTQYRTDGLNKLIKK
jgi:hypothetical protein